MSSPPLPLHSTFSADGFLLLRSVRPCVTASPYVTVNGPVPPFSFQFLPAFEDAREDKAVHGFSFSCNKSIHSGLFSPFLSVPAVSGGGTLISSRTSSLPYRGGQWFELGGGLRSFFFPLLSFLLDVPSTRPGRRRQERCRACGEIFSALPPNLRGDDQAAGVPPLLFFLFLPRVPETILRKKSRRIEPPPLPLFLKFALTA